MVGAGTVAAKRDAAVSSVLIVVGLAAIVRINTVGTSRAAFTQTLTHASLPTLYASMLVFLSALMLIGSLRALLKRRSSVERGDADRSLHRGASSESNRLLLRWLGTLAALVVYAGLLPHVQFLLLTTSFLAILFWLFGRTGLVKVAAASITGGFAFYLLFIVFLRLPL